jgi:Flp pilus assembly pilin Flp
MVTLQALLADENGFIVSTELILIVTIAVLALIVGLSEVAVAVNTELNDVSNAIGSIKQDFAFSGFHSGSGHKTKSFFAGSGFDDREDDCDCNTSCDLVCGTHGVTGKEN